MIKAISRYVVGMGLLVLLALPASGQNASASVTAEVQRPLTVTKTNDMDFGEVFPGVNKVIGVTDAGAGTFHIFGQDNAQVMVNFTLPGTLSSGANSLNIISWVARYSSTSSPASGTDFTPSVTQETLSLSSTGNLYIFLGATAVPTVTQEAGTYTGTITINVTYF